MAAKIQHTVFFKFPDLASGSEDYKKILGVLGKFNKLPGIQAQFGPAGTKTTDKKGLLEQLDWPDRSQDFTHALLVIADDVASLKGYLHSSEHKEEWVGAVKPHANGPPIVFDSDLAVPLQPSKDSLLHVVLFKMSKVTDDHEKMPEFLRVIGEFNKMDGIDASFKRIGHNGMSKEELLKAIEWPDKAGPYTHCLTVVCQSADALKKYLHSDTHNNTEKGWVSVARPLFDDPPPSIILDFPLTMTAGPLEMKVSTKKPIGFYVRAAASFLKGTEAKEASEGREAMEAKEAVDELKISGLGEAINTAVAAATRAEAEGIGTVTKVETHYPDMPSGRGCAQIMITVKRK